jgi:LacI family transcriptional regulator
VRSDDEAGMADLVRHLIRRGMQRLSYVNGPDIASNRMRREAVLAALEAAGIEPRIREYAGSTDPERLARLAELVRRERPDALICYDDLHALHVMAALRGVGMAVPGDVAVTGFDGTVFSRLSNPQLTTVVQQSELLGETAVAMLVRSIEQGTAPEDVTVPVTLSLRESSG